MANDEPQSVDDVKALVDEHKIRFIRFWFTDILGQLKSFSINKEELDDAFEGGMGFDGSSITGFNAIEESDMIAMPDATTFKILPWRPEESGVGRVFCDIVTPDRQPYEGDPRHVLRRALGRAQEMGFDAFNVGPELEFFLFRDDRSTEVLDRGGYFDLTTLDAGADVPRDIVLALDRSARPRRLLRSDDARRGVRRPARHRAGARPARDPRRVHPSRGRAVAARDRHALRRRAEDGRRLHDLPDHRQGVRDEVRLACHFHAEADLRRERLGDAHPPVAL